jgi:hypothetical protein
MWSHRHEPEVRLIGLEILEGPLKLFLPRMTAHFKR